ncbi:MAG: indole-3-glycerol phosphate synthase TrpC [Bacillota bacterium]|nr:indole-3-glycerol phosphate synthase TrpC [Bacillota bacterium]
MENILTRIISEKKQEISRLKEIHKTFQTNSLEKRSFIQKLQVAEEICVIAEFKRASPSKGIINANIDPVEQAKLYETSGASALSVLTDNTFFKGSFDDLKIIRENVGLPILCKDFIIDRVQIEMASASGADIILLIAAALDASQLSELHHHATQLGVEVLVEVHNLEDLDKAFNAGSRLIGVNNRDLKTFNVSLDFTLELGPMVKSFGAYLISESGIFTSSDAKRVRDVGADGILVGEALMTSANIQKSIADFKIPLLREM